MNWIKDMNYIGLKMATSYLTLSIKNVQVRVMAFPLPSGRGGLWLMIVLTNENAERMMRHVLLGLNLVKMAASASCLLEHSLWVAWESISEAGWLAGETTGEVPETTQRERRFAEPTLPTVFMNVKSLCEGFLGPINPQQMMARGQNEKRGKVKKKLWVSEQDLQEI